MTVLSFWVDGEPIPKQSFRYGSGRGRSRISARVAAWQELIAGLALTARQEAGGMDVFHSLMDRHVSVTAHFYRERSGRCDLDNLLKAVLDGLKLIVFTDDDQVVGLHAYVHQLGRTQEDPYADKDIVSPGCDISIRYLSTTAERRQRTNS